MLIQEAAKLAELRLETVKRNSELMRQPVSLLDPIVMVEQYYKWLTHLWKHNELPVDDEHIQR